MSYYFFQATELVGLENIRPFIKTLLHCASSKLEVKFAVNLEVIKTKPPVKI